MPVEWNYAAHVRAAPDAVFAWMTEFTEDDHTRPAFRRGAGMTRPVDRGSTRKIVSSQGDVVRVEDPWGGRGMPMKVTIDRAARATHLEGQWGYRSTWRAVADGDGTRVEVEGELAPPGLMRLFSGLFAGKMKKDLEADFNGHIADLRESLGVR
ncbi:MAG: SRPBCC family protein [Thermoplasmatota archaeon]